VLTLRAIIGKGRKPVGLIALGVLPLLGYRLEAGRPESAKPDLFVEPSALDFGEIYERKEIRLELPITNTTSREIVIDGFASSCACAAVTPRRVSIPPGGTRTVAVTIDLTIKTEKISAIRIEDVSVRLWPHLTDEKHGDIRWKIHGRVKRMFGVPDPALLDFGEVDPDLKTGWKSNRVRFWISPDVRDLRCDASQAYFHCDLERSSSPTGEWILSGTLDGRPPYGRFNCFVTIEGTVSDKTAVSTAVGVVGQVVDDVYMLPDSLGFGLGKIGEERSDSVILRSKSGHPFQVTGFEHDPATTKVTAVKAPQGSYAFRITQRITATGDNYPKLGFNIEGPDRRRSRVLPLPATYYGIAR
jgi:hypothetical protein